MLVCAVVCVCVCDGVLSFARVRRRLCVLCGGVKNKIIEYILQDKIYEEEIINKTNTIQIYI
jgi:hypothetical protein